ncbi:hypothetical protein BZA05DRAFT_440802 [Tricharina praecox]|uniref:uncharacterized protein n=1 Tax=Tricharina praecox TaxID=43433 RepID=UPI002220D5DD|nr:uncharacterized protein BZA05DRAFT_440802 [Tricharina praecox]KAI5859222.1 hypothetical protein BZA05DRAFT_440802 [Tricharina praecox]
MHNPPAKRKVVYIPQDNLREFHKHLQSRTPNTEFRFRPSVSNSSLLGRRSNTNKDQLAASTSGSLIPTNWNFVDLVTPEPPTPHEHRADSGYISGPTTNSSSTTSGSPGVYAKAHPHASHPVRGAMPATTFPANVAEYKAAMEQSAEQIFLHKYVSKEFTYDSRKAREQLKPVLRRALDRKEDRPMVDKFFLHVNFKKGTIRGEHRRQRLHKKPGQRRVDLLQATYESSDYFSRNE